MSEKPETDEFDEDLEEPTVVLDDGDMERASRELELARKRASKGGVPAWRRLELLREQRLTAEQTSDFEDYDLEERPRRATR